MTHETEKPEEKAIRLARMMEKLLEAYVTEDPKIAAPYMARVREIRKQISQLGFYVEWKATIDLKTPETPNITVTLYRPKQNLSPEDRALYEKWLRRTLGEPK